MEGPVNCGFAQTVSACRVAFKLLINPERPVDGGTFHTLDVKAPERSIFDAHEPAACQWYFTPLGLLIDLVVTALAPVLPDKVAAAHFGDSMVLFLAGKDPRRDDAAVPPRDAARRRLGRLRGWRRTGRADQQRQRRLQGLPGRGLRGEVPGDDPRLWLPARHRRSRTVPGRLRALPPLRRRAGSVPLSLARPIGDAGLGTVRRA